MPNFMRRAVNFVLGNVLGSRKHRIVFRVKRQKLTYLSGRALLELYDEVRRIEEEDLEGDLIEAGCALGGSAIIIASAKSRQRAFDIYDVFDIIPEPSQKNGEDVHDRYRDISGGEAKGIGSDKYYGYMDDLLGVVKRNFRRNGIDPTEGRINFIEGRFEEVMEIDRPVALAHIDGDWYESVMTCLRKITPNLVRGGVLVVDDYHEWSGCRRAVDEYFSDNRNSFVFRGKSRLQIEKK